MYLNTTKFFSIYDFQTRKLDYRFECDKCRYKLHCATDCEDRERCPIERILRSHKQIDVHGIMTFFNHKRFFIFMTPESREIIEQTLKTYSKTK